VAFTYLLSTEIGEVRLGLADTGGVAPGSVATSGYAFEDAEITYFLSKAGSVDGAIGLGAKTLLADSARRQRFFVLPGMTYDDRGRVSALKQLVEMYGAEMPTVAVRMPAPTAFDSGFTDPTPTLTSSGS
jgi:hypothetical protein